LEKEIITENVQYYYGMNQYNSSEGIFPWHYYK